MQLGRVRQQLQQEVVRLLPMTDTPCGQCVMQFASWQFEYMCGSGP